MRRIDSFLWQIVLAAALLVGRPAAAQLTIVHADSVIPPRAEEALNLDPLDLFTTDGVPEDERMNVGVRVKLDFDCPGCTTVEDVQWTIPGSIVKDYTILSNRATGRGFLTECSTDLLSPADLQQTSVTYYYTAKGTSEVTLSARVDGAVVPTVVSHTFVVERNPKAEIFYVTGDGSDVWTNAEYNDPTFEDKDNWIGEHPRWHSIDPGGEEFLRFHRGFIGKGDCWRGIFGYSCHKIYATAPGYVPAGDGVDHESLCCTGPPPCVGGLVCEGGPGLQGTCPAGQTCEARVGTGVIDRGRFTVSHGAIQELPFEFTIAGGLAGFAPGNLSTDIQSPYHNLHHGRICSGGDYTPTSTTPVDPIFPRFHGMLTSIFELWQFLQLDNGTMLPAVEATSPAGAQVFFPDPDVVTTACLDPVIQSCDANSGSVFPLGITTVDCTLMDVMQLDDTFPEGLCSGTGEPCDSNDDCPADEFCDNTALDQGTAKPISFDVTVEDTTAPEITCPGDVTIECDEVSDPSNTGAATAMDIADPDPMISFADAETPGVCAEEKTITRTWTATDGSGNSASCDQTINVIDTIAPTIECEAPDTIAPPDAPTSFTATTVDNCDAGASVEITGFDCFKFTRTGKRIDKTESCIVEVNGDTITILDSGGVNDHIRWTARATDGCGNFTDTECEVEVVNPGKKP